MRLMLRASALAGCLAAASFAQEDYSTWGRFKAITINTSASGANIADTLRHFPLLIRLDSSHAEVFNQGRPGGADLRFRRPGGPALPYKIESWDSAFFRAEIWVSVDQILPNNATQTINMYWQKGEATAQSNAAAVFDSAKGFVGVWHMGGALGPRPNSVPGGPTARGGTTATAGTFTGRSRQGVVGTSDSLAGGTGAGGGEFFDVSPMPTFATGFTFSFWARVTSTTNRSWMRFFDFGNGEAMANLFAGRQGTSTTLRFDVLPTQLAVPNGIVLNEWKYYTFTVTGQDLITFLPSQMKAYIDRDSVGVMEAELTVEERASSFLGRSNWAADAYFTGFMDEVHVSKVARSTGWVRLSYETQRPGANLLTFSASATPVGLDRVHGTAVPSLRVTRQGPGFAITLPPGREADMRLSVVDAWGRTVWSGRAGRHAATLTWNGVRADGKPLARGMYLVRLAPMSGAGSEAWEGKFVHAH